MMNNDSAIAKRYLDLLTYAKYCCYSDEDTNKVKQFKDGLYLTELKDILEDAKEKSNNKTLLTFLQKYYDYLDKIKDQTLRNSYYYYDNSFTRHKNIMSFKLEQHEDAKFLGVQLNFDDVFNYFNFESLPDKSKQEFGQQYKEKYKTLLFISLTTTVCAIAGFTAAVCLLTILNPASIWFMLLLMLVLVLPPIGCFSVVASVKCEYTIRGINSYQQDCKTTPPNTPNASAKTDQKNQGLFHSSSCFTLRTEDDTALDLAWMRTQ